MRIIYQKGEAEITEKKSRFIGELLPAASEEAAAAAVDAARKRYYDARHHCFAYRIGGPAVTVRMSDDGEPAGTAGKPIAEVLSREGLIDCVAVVTRYFGGTLLGTGGLFRAYEEAAKAALDAAVVLERLEGRNVTVSCDYALWGKIQYRAAEKNLTLLDTAYGAEVTAKLLCPEDAVQALTAELTDLSAGRARIAIGKTAAAYGVRDGKVILL